MNILIEKIKIVLREEDIEGYIKYHGAPADEYDSEAEEIALALQQEKSPTEELVLSVIIPIWARLFNLDDQDMTKRMPYLKNVARSLTEKT